MVAPRIVDHPRRRRLPGSGSAATIGSGSPPGSKGASTLPCSSLRRDNPSDMLDQAVRADPETGVADSDSNRWARLAWPLGALALLAIIAAATVLFLSRSAIHSLDEADITDVVTPIGYAVIGALLASRRSRNPVGWIFL